MSIQIKNSFNEKSFFHHLPLAAGLCMVAVVVIFILTGHSVTAETLLDYTPSNPWLAAILMLILFALKSMTYVFPINLLFIVNGIMFPIPIAILLNFVGAAITYSLPYFIGREYGSHLLDSLFRRYPKLQQLQQFQQDNDFFLSFITRMIGILPCDVVSLYMGSIQMNYRSYLAGGLIGNGPFIIAITIMGVSLSDPTSPQFLIAFGCELLLVIGASIWYKRYHAKKKASKEQT
jgi:uncharacterized membrane protein YdjX (TVP38/TMEM64 family)